MSVKKRWRVGDRVRHRGMNEEGIISDVYPNDTIVVRFDKRRTRHPHENIEGVYDLNWFATHPDGLQLIAVKKLTERKTEEPRNG